MRPAHALDDQPRELDAEGMGLRRPDPTRRVHYVWDRPEDEIVPHSIYSKLHTILTKEFLSTQYSSTKGIHALPVPRMEVDHLLLAYGNGEGHHLRGRIQHVVSIF